MAAVYGTVYARGLKTGTMYAVDIYLSDAAAAKVTWDDGAGATSTSQQFYVAPEDLVIYDVAVASGTATAVGMVFTANGQMIPAARLRLANILNTLATRANIAIGYKEGTNIGAIQF